MPGEKYLVTGCAGFIGGHMLKKLTSEKIDTVGVDDFSTGKRENMAECEGKFTFIEGDLCDPAVAREAVKGVTHIMHLASIPSVPRSVENPMESMQSSVTSTVSLLDAARRAGVARVVQAVSSAAYGDSPFDSKTETDFPDPLSPYAASKLAQEYYGLAFARCYEIDTAAVRYFNVFGPRQDPNSEYAAVIPKFITLMLENKQPVIFGDGTQSRDFTYVDNIVQGNLAALRHPRPLGGSVINIACGSSVSLNDLVAKLNKILGTDIEAIHSAPRVGDIVHSRANVAKAKELLGFTPQIDFDEGLKRTVEFFKHPN